MRIDHPHAYFYDAEYTFTEDVDLFAALIKDAPGEVLELGCGTGRVLVPLAERGSRITGVDHDPRMLDQCRAKLAARDAALQGRVDLFEDDLCTCRLDRRFTWVLLPFNVLMILGEAARQRAALDNAFLHLVPGGRCVVSVMHPTVDWVQQRTRNLACFGAWTDPSSGRVFERFYWNSVAPARQEVTYHVFYDLPDETGMLRRYHAPVHMRYLFSFELQHMMEAAGFRIEHLLGNHLGQDFTGDSPLMVFVGVKDGAGGEH